MAMYSISFLPFHKLSCWKKKQNLLFSRLFSAPCLTFRISCWKRSNSHTAFLNHVYKLDFTTVFLCTSWSTLRLRPTNTNDGKWRKIWDTLFDLWEIRFRIRTMRCEQSRFQDLSGLSWFPIWCKSPACI